MSSPRWLGLSFVHLSKYLLLQITKLIMLIMLGNSGSDRKSLSSIIPKPLKSKGLLLGGAKVATLGGVACLGGEGIPTDTCSSILRVSIEKCTHHFDVFFFTNLIFFLLSPTEGSLLAASILVTAPNFDTFCCYLVHWTYMVPETDGFTV